MKNRRARFNDKVIGPLCPEKVVKQPFGWQFLHFVLALHLGAPLSGTFFHQWVLSSILFLFSHARRAYISFALHKWLQPFTRAALTPNWRFTLFMKRFLLFVLDIVWLWLWDGGDGVHWKISFFIYYVCIGIFQTTAPCVRKTIRKSQSAVSGCRTVHVARKDGISDAPVFARNKIFYLLLTFININSLAFVVNAPHAQAQRQRTDNTARIAIDAVKLTSASVTRSQCPPLSTIAYYFIQWTFRLPYTLPTFSIHSAAQRWYQWSSSSSYSIFIMANSIISILLVHTRRELLLLWERKCASISYAHSPQHTHRGLWQR